MFVANVMEQSQVFEYTVPGLLTSVNLDPDHWILRQVQDVTPVQVPTMSYNEGWNLVSLPTDEENIDYHSVFPEAVEGTFYQFSSGVYIGADVFQSGVGYWIRNTDSGAVLVDQNQINSLTYELQEGWNLIGSIATEIPITMIYDPDNVVVMSSIYTYDASYQSVDLLQPCKAYWVRANTSGTISIILTP